MRSTLLTEDRQHEGAAWRAAGAAVRPRVASVRAAAMLAEVALIWLVFFFHAGWPVPDPNEPHYLTKARHYWEPNWLAGDLFLDSPSGHHVFFLSLGWLATALPFPAAAWVGRAFTWGLLAWAWHRLSWTLVPRRGAAVLSAAVFIALSERAHMAGEWVVGGFEAKGIAYALVFLGLAALVAGRWGAAWAWLGGATAFHVLVGGWTMVVAGCLLPGELAAARPAKGVGGNRDRRRGTIRGLVAGLLLALAGLVPALYLTAGTDRDVLRQAAEVYFQRLSHHLDVLAFDRTFVARHLLLLAGWLFLCTGNAADEQHWRLRWIVAGAVSIAVIGAILCAIRSVEPAVVTGLLRYYWFRLSDAILPLGVALAGVSAAVRADSRVWAWLLVLAAAVETWSVSGRPLETRPRADKPGKVVDVEAWQDVCRWVRENTPADARFLTPRSCQTFKWYAQRSEIVTWKDVPQDPRGLVEWNRRMQEVFGGTDLWGRPLQHGQPGGMERARLLKLAETYGAAYAVAEVEADAEVPVLYSNAFYAVYDLRGGE